jgi:hypothetical protein
MLASCILRQPWYFFKCFLQLVKRLTGVHSTQTECSLNVSRAEPAHSQASRRPPCQKGQTAGDQRKTKIFPFDHLQFVLFGKVALGKLADARALLERLNNTPNVPWMFPECSLNVPWKPNVPWMFPECSLNVPWKPNVPRMFPERKKKVKKRGGGGNG